MSRFYAIEIKIDVISLTSKKTFQPINDEIISKNLKNPKKRYSYLF